MGYSWPRSRLVSIFSDGRRKSGGDSSVSLQPSFHLAVGYRYCRSDLVVSGDEKLCYSGTEMK